MTVNPVTFALVSTWLAFTPPGEDARDVVFGWMGNWFARGSLFDTLFVG